MTRVPLNGRDARTDLPWQMRVHGGTLVIVVPTNDGLVFLADRADSDPNGRLTGAAQKLEVVGDRFAFAVAGTAAVDDPQGRCLFDVRATTRKYLAGRQPSLADQNYMRVLRDAIAEGLNQMPFSAWPPERQGPLCEVVLGWAHDDGPRVQVVSVGYTRKQPLLLAPKRLSCDPEHFTKAAVVVLGQSAVWRELLQGSDARFDEARARPEIRLFAEGKAPRSDMSHDDALEFAQQLLRLTRDRTPLLGPRPVGVSAEYDYVHLTTRGAVSGSSVLEPGV